MSPAQPDRASDPLGSGRGGRGAFTIRDVSYIIGAGSRGRSARGFRVLEGRAGLRSGGGFSGGGFGGGGGGSVIVVVGSLVIVSCGGGGGGGGGVVGGRDNLLVFLVLPVPPVLPVIPVLLLVGATKTTLLLLCLNMGRLFTLLLPLLLPLLLLLLLAVSLDVLVVVLLDISEAVFEEGIKFRIFSLGLCTIVRALSAFAYKLITSVTLLFISTISRTIVFKAFCCSDTT